MNIKDFRESIDGKILSRGYDYYLDGVVDLLNSDGDGYIFQVQGSLEDIILPDKINCR